MDIKFYQGDIPENLDLGKQIAVDTETMGLLMRRDRLCLVQLSSGDGVCHLVQIKRGVEPVNLKNMLGDNSRLKLYHYARFDVATLHWHLGVMAQPIFCTKIASKLVRTYTDKHGLGDLCRELLNINLDKTMQSSDWGAEKLTDAQLKYAAQDVLYLHQLRGKLTDMLKRENRTQLAEASFAFLPIRAALDQAGYENIDIFSH
ncbi:MAG: ribonuclease D [Alphaproteobacteria bacterium]|nr:ribonuclease D [Alphaproteobacteria bacterium]